MLKEKESANNMVFNSPFKTSRGEFKSNTVNFKKHAQTQNLKSLNDPVADSSRFRDEGTKKNS